MSKSDSMVMRWVAEVTQDVIPLDPALAEIRFTDESLALTVDHVVTGEADDGRMDLNVHQVAHNVGGDINFEYSFDSHDQFIAAACGWSSFQTWGGAGDKTRIQNAGDTMRTFYIQKNFGAEVSGNEMHRFSGMGVNQFTFKVEIGKIVMGTLSFVGLTFKTATNNPPSTPTFPVKNTTSPFTGATSFKDFTLDAVLYTGCITMVSMSFKNNLKAIRCLGKKGPSLIRLGKFELTGDLELYFANGDLVTSFLDGTEIAFSFELVDEDGNKYTYKVNRARLENVETVAGGKDTDIMFSAKWRALKPAGVMFEIEKDPSATYVAP